MEIIKCKRPSILHIPQYGFKHFNKDGKLLWTNDKQIDNLFHDEGEMALLSAYFATTMTGYGAPPANLYLGLDARATLAEADTLASLSGEPTTGTGYARIALSTAGTGASGQDFYIHQPSAAYGAESKTVTFTNSSTTTAWGGVTKLFLCTSDAVGNDTGKKIICSLALSTTRTLQPGDSMQTSINTYLGE